MNTDTPANATWELLDRRRVQDLVSKHGAARVLSTMMSDPLPPEQRIAAMRELAVAGNILRLRADTSELMAWAEGHGLRRLNNALIELDRVLALPARGQAILQAQALTRFIALNLEQDIMAFRRAVSGS